jgi:RNA polymerase sigma factor (sigma-70 family)
MTTGTGNLTDRQLLERFATQHDEEGFAQLMERHGRMVLGVCRQILRHEQDAEDAFQATFLVLSRKAGSIRSGEALPNWLFNVANRLARRIRASAQRRQAHEVALVEPPLSEQEPGGNMGDLGPILYEEIGRLPDKYRLPFVLCYLEGKTNEQAAQQLGCPPGTVFSRLARARERLRGRLTRRGLAVTSGVLAASLSSLSEQASAAVPQLLESTTIRAALGFGTGKLGSASLIPARVVNLARWGVWSLSWRGLQVAGSLLLLAALGGTLLIWFLRPRPAEQPVQNGPQGGLAGEANLDIPRPGEQPIQNRLQGTWAPILANIEGVPIPGAQAQVTFKDNQMTLSGTAGTYQIDAGKNPMQIDWTVGGGVVHGIIALQGKELTLCFPQASNGAAGNEPPRPADFRPEKGKMIMTFKPLEP